MNELDYYTKALRYTLRVINWNQCQFDGPECDNRHCGDTACIDLLENYVIARAKIELGAGLFDPAQFTQQERETLILLCERNLIRQTVDKPYLRFYMQKNGCTSLTIWAGGPKGKRIKGFPDNREYEVLHFDTGKVLKALKALK